MSACLRPSFWTRYQLTLIFCICMTWHQPSTAIFSNHIKHSRSIPADFPQNPRDSRRPHSQAMVIIVVSWWYSSDAAWRQYYCVCCADAEPVRGGDHGQLWLPDARLLHPRTSPPRRVHSCLGRLRPGRYVSSPTGHGTGSHTGSKWWRERWPKWPIGPVTQWPSSMSVTHPLD